MSEHKTDAPPIESEVPDKQELREGITQGTTDGINNSQIDIKNPTDDENPGTIKEDFVYSPVITVTKEESTFTKGDVKLQKIIVSEDISDNTSTIKKSLQVTAAQTSNEIHTEICSKVSSETMDTESDKANNDINNNEGDKEKHPQIISKIPKLRLKQVVERITNEKRMIRNKENNERARSSIPRLKDLKNPPEIHKDTNQNKNQQLVVSPGVDAEFDKIYEQILEGENSNNLPSLEKIDDPVKLESKFEEIIHHYDDNHIQLLKTEKIKSKIPLLKRKSEQSIEIPPPNIQQNSLKKSNTDNKDDSKVNIPVVNPIGEKTFKPDIDYAKKYNSTNAKIIGTNSNEIKSDTIVKRSYNYINKTSVKSSTTHKSNETIELVNISSTGNKEIMENKIGSKIADITSAKENVEFKINSASLNKHPIRKNIIDRISVQETMADKEDKTNDKEVVGSLSDTLLNVKSFTDIALEEKAIYVTSETSLNKKVTSKQVTSALEGDNNNTYTSNKIPYTDKNNYIEQIEITSESQRNPVFDMPTIPSNLTTLEKNTTINKNNSLSSENFAHSINKISRLKENKHFENVINSKHSSFYTHSLENDNNTQTNEIKGDYSTSVMINQKETDTYISETDIKNSIEQSSSVVAQNEKVAVYTNKKKNDTFDSKQFHENTYDFIKSSNIREQENNINTSGINNSNDRYLEGAQTSIETVYAINNDSKEIRIEGEKSQKITKAELINLESQLGPGSVINENNNIKVAQSNILSTSTLERKYTTRLRDDQTYENHLTQEININETRDTSVKQTLKYSKNIFEDNEKAFEKLVSVEESSQDLNRKIELYLSAQNTNITETEEEDIIVLKGKVNRVIRRLDSKEYKASKKEVDDVPKEVSVITKIAIFENESTNAIPNRNEQILNARPCDVKPKIVDEILKNTNKSNFNISHNELDNKPIYEKLDELDVQDLKSSKKFTNTEAFGSKINVSETIKIQRNPSTTYESNEVFIKKEDQKSSLEIWNEYRMRKEASDIQRARSLAELDLGDAVSGKVKQMVFRMNSVERTNMSRKQFIDFKEKPRIGSVSQRIALFEVSYSSSR